MVIFFGALGGVVVGGFAVAAWHDYRAKRRGWRVRVKTGNQNDPGMRNSQITGMNQGPP